MSATPQSSFTSRVTPTQVWADLSADRRAQLIAAAAQLAVQWMLTRPAGQARQLWKEAQEVYWIDQSQDSAHTP